MQYSDELRQSKAYRLSLWCLGGLTLGVLAVVAGVIVKIATGSVVVLVIALVVMVACVVTIWSALFMLIRWARDRHRAEGVTTYDALVQVRHQMDIDVRRLLRRI